MNNRNLLNLTFSFLVASLGLFSLVSCSQGSSDSGDLPDGIYAKINTNKGSITCRLEYQKVPMTVANFIGLSEGSIPNNIRPEGEPFFDDLTFHRVVPNFMIQGGDPLANGMGGPGYSFPDEFDPDLMHNVAGTLSMANSGPATNGSQFYITDNATPWLDSMHSVFGYVIDGPSMTTVYKIQQGDIIENIEIIRVGGDAKDFNAPEIFKEKSGLQLNQ